VYTSFLSDSPTEVKVAMNTCSSAQKVPTATTTNGADRQGKSNSGTRVGVIHPTESYADTENCGAGIFIAKEQQSRCIVTEKSD
jgi:hypothetical protein